MKIPARLKSGDAVKFVRGGVEVSGTVLFATTETIQIVSNGTHCVRARLEVRKVGEVRS